MTDQTKLHLIAMEYLFEGMEIADDIFNFNGRLLLLSKGTVLTENEVRRLRDINAFNRNISVSAKTYDKLIEHGLSHDNGLTQQYLEDSIGYTDLKDQAGDMLFEIQESKKMTVAGQIAADMVNKLSAIDPSLIFQCINAPNPMDEYLKRHSVNVALINGLMSRWLGMSDEDVNTAMLAGLVHDVGKTQIPMEILEAPRRLTVCEFEVMKMHPVYSYNLLSSDPRFSDRVKLAARHHHEKVNGTGYPDKLHGDEISLLAKITAVSDIYDAMVSKRSYKEANNPFSIIARLAMQQFSDLDLGLVRLFTKNMPNELLDRPCLLSDGSIGIVKYILASDLEYPIVEVNGTVVQTSEDYHCVRMILDASTAR